MAAVSAASLEERLYALLRELGIAQAHFAARTPQDWIGLAAAHPELFHSLILLNTVDARSVEHLTDRLLLVTGDRGAAADAARGAVTTLPGARHVCLGDYDLIGWSDVAAERPQELAAAMLDFLMRMTPPEASGGVRLAEGEGEAAGITYRIRGAGPPLVLLPLFLSPSQWEPVVPLLANRYCTITLSGAALGAVAVLESRGHAVSYLQMVRSLIEEARLRPGDRVLEVGCGTGVLCRWLAERTKKEHPMTGVDLSPFLLREAQNLARREGLGDAIEFLEGNAEALPLPDDSLDVTISVTVIEEVDADRMLAEMVRVTRPGGRVAVIARAMDMPFLVNMPLSNSLKAKVQAPGAFGSVAAHGCADASLYARMLRAGLTELKVLPQLTAFGAADAAMLAFMQGQILPRLSEEEAEEWRQARAQAEADGTFFLTWPHHGAVGTKPA